MNFPPHLQRALLLQEQGRDELAEKEVRAHLAQEPNDGFAHAFLASCLVDLERRDEAEDAARTAVGLEPDMAFAHFSLARVLTDRNRNGEALLAIQEAIRLDPENPDFRALHAGIEFDRENWKGALAAAEEGLQFDAEHVGCNNLRAMALVKLGRKEEAGSTIASTLAREPENALSHANQGWTLLESGDRKRAQHHFRESLRLDAENDWARAGLVESIKAGNPLYALMLKYFLWMQKLSSGARWGIILGGYFGSRFLATLSESNPSLSPWVTPIRVLYISFALLTWLAYPLCNLMLFVHPTGRHALNRDQRAQATWVGLSLGLALVSVVVWLLGGSGAFLFPAVVFGLLTLPISAIYMCPVGWPRRTMATITFSLLGFVLLGVTLLLAGHGEEGQGLRTLGGASIVVFVIGIFASQWIANWLATRRPSR